MKTLTHKYALVMRQPLQWGDMDASGRCGPATLLRLFETARLAYFETLIAPRLSSEVHSGFIRGRGVGRILRSASLEMAEGEEGRECGVRYPDSLWLGARTVSLSGDRFDQEYCAVSERDQRIVAFGRATIVTFDHVKNAKARVPAEVVQAMLAVEKMPVTQLH
ncbi:hypothetical protein CcCBS67573_g00149 [Chytriomyces confervae]|uniref:Thioesterase domain-containing protein n=1 Tax=Chytriomyces confervae TaxID=246404 RepID=A0A507FTC1_9FUNG|nr:hypothetical protein HDU80_010666 [Chytriomyces hyalinus]TPX78615.1 hypothetical protein CcCBS67573_g00149 [Chytriomyces confervae]